MPQEGREAGRRRLVFTNLVNGVPVAGVMAAFQLSEKEVFDDFAFVVRKIRSYRFMRAMPPVKIDTLAEAKGDKIACLWVLLRCNLDSLPPHGPIETLPFNPEPGRLSDAEIRLIETRLRAGAMQQ